MAHFTRTILLFLLSMLSLLIPQRLSAQLPNNAVDTAYFRAVDAANYDSLLHTFYMRQYQKSANRHLSLRVSQAYAEFDNIPDSVFVRRLQNLHMIVPMAYNSEVRAYIKLYVRIMSRRIDAMLSLSEYYFPMFEETLDRYGVPEELKYLTIVESALNPQATSRAGAAGLWQFMYATGRGYDLEINSLIDERRDPYKSTVAAARYLKRLYEMLGHDWILAMAAYNCGPGTVQKAIARSGGKTSFWEIYPYLPRETRGYIPAYIAATYAMNYYHEHGIATPKYEIPVHTDTINLHRDVHFAMVEKFADIPVQQLRQLNPQYRADIIPAGSRNYAICVPSNKVSLFLKNEDTIYSASKDTIAKRSAVTLSTTTLVYHKVKKGETTTLIARKYGVSVTSLRRWNGLRSKSSLKVGQRLKIYLPAPAASANASASDTTSTKIVADSTFSDSTAVPSTSAPSPKSNATTSQKKSTSTSTSSSKPVYYTVKSGDSLSKIASKNHTTVAKLRSLNNLKSDNLRVGQKLRVK